MSHARSAALLAAVVAEPDDDVPRLVYADWLGEQPDRVVRARGELIHMQCALAAPNVEHRDTIERRIRKLFDEHRVAWEQPFHETGAWVREWRRGFPYSLGVRATGDFVEHRAQWFADAPIRGLSFDVEIRDWIEDVVECEELSRIESLVLDREHYEEGDQEYPRPSLGDDGAAILARCHHLTALRTLRIGGHEIGVSGARALAAAPWMRALVELDLDDNPIGPNGVAVLAPVLASLKHLRLRRPVGVEGATAIAALRRLESLDLYFPELESAGARALAGSRTLTSLARLSIFGGRMGDDDVEALARAPAFQLATLELDLASDCNAAAIAIAAAPELGGLKKLVIGNVGLGAARALAASTTLCVLRELRLTGNESLPGVEAIIAQRTGLPALETFTFADDDIPF